MSAGLEPEELRELLAALREEVISEAQAQRLAVLLHGSREARRTYIHYMSIVANLIQDVGSTGAGVGPTRGGARPAWTLSPSKANDEGGMPKVEASSVSAPIHRSSFSIHHFNFLGSAALSYALCALLLLAGVLAAWTWRLPDRPPALAAAPVAHTQQRVAIISGAVDCQWADAGTAIEPGAAVPAGRRFVLASGLLQIWYDSRVEVILQGPAIYEADSPHGGFLSLGRLTARVEKMRETGGGRPATAMDFTIRTPSAILANQDTMPAPGVLGSAEFGVVVDSAEVTRVHVFRGLVTTRSAGAAKDAPALALPANRSLLVSRGVSRGMRDTSQKARMGDVRFARRAIVPLDGQREQLAWLKTIGAGTQRKFVAVGSGQDFELPPPTSSPAAAATPAGGLAGGGSSPAASPSGIVYTCRLSFDLGELDPATAMLRCDYLARNSIAAIRLNGKAIPRSQAAAARASAAVRESGAFVLHGGLHPGFFVPGMNVLELDVNNALPSDPPHVLWLRPEVSGIGILPTNGSSPGTARPSGAGTQRPGAKQ